jgi:hypothetical protein
MCFTPGTGMPSEQLPLLISSSTPFSIPKFFKKKLKKKQRKIGKTLFISC